MPKGAVGHGVGVISSGKPTPGSGQSRSLPTLLVTKVTQVKGSPRLGS